MLTQQLPRKLQHDPVDTASETYIRLFYPAVIGARAFVLWDMLRHIQADGAPWPTIDELASLLGPGTGRHAIVGRKASRSRPGQEGLLDELVKFNMLRYWIDEEGTPNQRYFFIVRETLPTLTAEQVAMLPPAVQERHYAFTRGNS